jgi:hypothetical protein
VNPRRDYDPDLVVVLVHADPPRFTLPGWTWIKCFCGPQFPLVTYLPLPAYEITWDKLFPWPPPGVEGSLEF